MSIGIACYFTSTPGAQSKRRLLTLSRKGGTFFYFFFSLRPFLHFFPTCPCLFLLFFFFFLLLLSLISPDTTNTPLPSSTMAKNATRSQQKDPKAAKRSSKKATAPVFGGFVKAFGLQKFFRDDRGTFHHPFFPPSSSFGYASSSFGVHHRPGACCFYLCFSSTYTGYMDWTCLPPPYTHPIRVV